MCQCSNTLHLNCVHILQWVVQDSGSIDHLPAKVFIIQMAHEERFGGESIGLYVDVCAGNFVDERGFSDVWVATNEEGPGIWVYGGKARDVLANLFEVGEGVFLTTHDCCHAEGIGSVSTVKFPTNRQMYSPTKGCFLQLFTAI